MLEYFDPVLLCPDCQVVRTDRSRHCGFCNKCVERFDHHCPWINNCVGTNNHGEFYIFIVSMLTLLLSTVVILCINYNVYEYAPHKYENKLRPNGEYLIPIIVPQITLDKITVSLVTYINVAICILFAMPLS